ERILNPLLYPLALSAQATHPTLIIMEDGAPSHIHHYHNQLWEQLGLEKLMWLVNSPDLNPIETIWSEMK
ncbi:hypothetical protein L873DRAFT_1566282, partial [Choiromyces venosus 120613-1]